MQWNILSDQKPESSRQLLEVLVANREIEDVEHFFHPVSPLDLSLSAVGIDEANVQKAIERLLIAKEKKEKVIIYGDYDADGVCATTVLWETLHTHGVQAMPFLPDREKHGYGLSERGVNEILEKGKPDIVISVDNGIVAHTQWQRLQDLGVYTILTDHHMSDGKVPPVDCLIHTTQLCGTTVAWMFAHEIEKKLSSLNSQFSTSSLLDLCAIATIADQVPLTEANRSFAKYGLEQLNKTERLGLKLLIEVAGLTLGEIDTYGVNFGIAPRINAMGRISSAMDALRALCTKNEQKARELMSLLSETNSTRQELTSEMIDLALEEKELWKEEHIIIVAHERFHEGVIGLIAGKLTEMFHKPTVVFALGERTAKGSARSVRGVHITNMLRSIQDDLVEVGGHPLAAGVKIETSKLQIVKDRLYTMARETIEASVLIPAISVDCELPVSLVSLETADALATLAPFGSSNPEPLFLLKSWRVVDAKQIGKENRHLKLNIQYTTPESRQIHMPVLFWNNGNKLDKFLSLPTIDLVGQIQINEWRGKRTIQFVLKDYLAALP